MTGKCQVPQIMNKQIEDYKKKLLRTQLWHYFILLNTYAFLDYKQQRSGRLRQKELQLNALKCLKQPTRTQEANDDRSEITRQTHEGKGIDVKQFLTAQAIHTYLQVQHSSAP